MKGILIIGSITICLGITLGILYSWIPVLFGVGLTGAFILGVWIG